MKLKGTLLGIFFSLTLMGSGWAQVVPSKSPTPPPLQISEIFDCPDLPTFANRNGIVPASKMPNAQLEVGSSSPGIKMRNVGLAVLSGSILAAMIFDTNDNIIYPMVGGGAALVVGVGKSDRFEKETADIRRALMNKINDALDACAEGRFGEVMNEGHVKVAGFKKQKGYDLSGLYRLVGFNTLNPVTRETNAFRLSSTGMFLAERPKNSAVALNISKYSLPVQARSSK